MLSQSQISEFWRNGFVQVEKAFSQEALQPLLNDFDEWVEESRQHKGPFGKMLDGRPRFDVEPGHSAKYPGLRRIASPEEISEVYLSILRDGPLIDAAEALLGPDLRFHHAKLNAKLPDSGTVVKWHQDFTFDPHSNDDCVTAILYLSDVFEDNGALRVVPGSHRGPLYSLRQNGVFTGVVDETVSRQCEQQAIDCIGPMGSLCLMHTRTLHSSRANLTELPRTLYIATLTSADAVSLVPCAVPSKHGGMIVRGQDSGRIRAIQFEMEMPEIPQGASFFAQQQQKV